MNHLSKIISAAQLPASKTERRHKLGKIAAKATFNPDELYLFELRRQGIATVFIAVNKKSIDSSKLLFRSRSTTGPDLRDIVSYGGARVISPEFTRQQAIASLIRLANSESGVKQKLGNIFLRTNGLNRLVNSDHEIQIDLPGNDRGVTGIQKGYRVPDEYFKQLFYGGRFVILPEDANVHQSLLTNPDSSYYEEIFRPLGEFLNGKRRLPQVDQSGKTLKSNKVPNGSLLLTPDFARFNGLATKLLALGRTSNVLGVAPELGGCSGKASFTAQSILQVLETSLKLGLFKNYDPRNTRISLIGSGGGLGCIVADNLSSPLYRINGMSVSSNISVSDCRYLTDEVRTTTNGDQSIPVVFGKEVGEHTVPRHWEILECDKSTIIEGPVRERFSFSDKELLVNREPGIIIATTTGNELQNSNWRNIPSGTLLILAHNNALPAGEEGINIAEELHENGVTVIPGPPTTMGGAMTSRLEPPIRAYDRNVFPKALAHAALMQASDSSLRNIIDMSNSARQAGTPISPWSALLLLTNQYAVE